MAKIYQIIKLIVITFIFSFFVVGEVAAQENDPTPVPIPTPTAQFFLSPLAESETADLYNGDNRSWTRFKYHKIIKNVSDKYNLDPQLIYATIMTESEGDEYAYRYEPHINDASLCMGQILVSTARSLGFEGNPLEIYKPEVCIDLIGRYHRRMLEEYGDLTPIQLAIAYNTGSPWKRPVPGHLFRFRSWYL